MSWHYQGKDVKEEIVRDKRTLHNVHMMLALEELHYFMLTSPVVHQSVHVSMKKHSLVGSFFFENDLVGSFDS